MMAFFMLYCGIDRHVDGTRNNENRESLLQLQRFTSY